jgi:Holliday junction resolvase
VIHFTRHWNPAKEDQATDRAYRIGQEREVFVYCPIVKADDFTTFDVKLDRLLMFKRGLAEDMLNGSADVGPADFDIADMAPPGQRAGLAPRVSVGDLDRMQPRYFEGFVAALWRKQGFGTVYVTPPQDGGVDVVAIKGRSGALIQCKTSTADGAELGWDAVKDVTAGHAIYAKRHPGIAFEKVCATNQFFNPTTHDRARDNDVDIVERPTLERLLAQHEVTKLDVEKMLVTDWGGTA